MKKIVLTGTAALVVACTCLTGCSDDPAQGGGVTGKVVPTVNLDTRVTASDRGGAVKAPASRAESSAMEIGLDDLTLTLTPKDGSEPYTCKGVSSFPLDKEFKVGEYEFEASYGDPEAEGFDLPAYYGTESIIVEENRTTSVSLQASLVNSMVSIEFGDALVNYATNLSAHLQTTGDKIAFATTETRAAYIRPGAANVTVTMTKPNGVSGTVAIPVFTAKAKYHHHVKLDVNGGSGDAVLNITFDDTVENEDVEIELSDDILNAPAPVATAKGFVPGEAVEFVPGLGAGSEMAVDITAQATIASAVMTTKSASLLAAGWPSEIDLVKATPAEQQQLKALGLSALGLFKNPGRMAVVDFTDITRHISYVEGGDNTTEITLTVIDTASKSSEPVVLTLGAQELEMGLTAVTTAYPEAAGMPIELMLDYNGHNPKEEVAFQYFNERGTWDALEVVSIEAAGRSSSSFKAVVKAPAIDFSVEIRAYCAALAKTSETVVVKQVPFRLESDENATFARSTVLTVKSSTLDASAAAKSGELKLSPAAPGASVSVDGAAISITGLEPGTTYRATLSYDGDECNAAEFTTESATQLANAGLEDWTSTAHKSNCVEYFVGGDWGTLNPLTISQVGSAANVAYAATSGTIPTTGVSGQGACIRTIGWGAGTTAAGSISKIKHVDRGELFLGKWGSTVSDEVLPDYGIDFASRPSGLTFKYKFTKVKNHTGYAEVRVLDASGATIAQNSTEIDSQPDYTDLSLPLSYAAGSAKAARLIVIFRSTNSGKPIDGNALGKSDVNTVSIQASKVHTGSELYIDDVQLNY